MRSSGCRAVTVGSHSDTHLRPRGRGSGGSVGSGPRASGWSPSERWVFVLGSTWVCSQGTPVLVLVPKPDGLLNERKHLKKEEASCCAS